LASHDFVLFRCSRREQRQRTILWAVSKQHQVSAAQHGQSKDTGSVPSKTALVELATTRAALASRRTKATKLTQSVAEIDSDETSLGQDSFKVEKIAEVDSDETSRGQDSLAPLKFLSKTALVDLATARAALASRRTKETKLTQSLAEIDSDETSLGQDSSAPLKFPSKTALVEQATASAALASRGTKESKLTQTIVEIDSVETVQKTWKGNTNSTIMS
jgi:hypothetical protein